MIIKVKDNKIWLHGRMWSGDDMYFDHHFSQIEKVHSEIKVHVHSIGGDVFTGNYIHSRLKNSEATIDMQVDGVAFSMGAFLLPAADKRSIVKNGFVMVHQAQGTTRGTAADHRSNAELLDGMNENFIEDLITMTGKARKSVLKWFEGDTYFNSKKALENGIVDEIVDPVVNVKINEKQAIANPELFGQFEALLATSQTQNNYKSKSIKMKLEIIAKYGLTGLTEASSDTAVFEALEKHFNAQSKTADLTALQGKYDILEKSVKDQKEAKIEALLKPLEGKLDKDKIETYRTIGETSGIEALSLALEGVKGRPDIAALFTGRTDASVTATVKDGWDWDKYQKEDPRGIEALAKNNPDAYLALGKAKFGNQFQI
ncbi:MAG: ATP-dependent Clp protease proteolytic subunit [Polaribacter sp.]|uniref:Clp protease ClpP n=1 Tax=Polaribacter sp. TaxID=1920175 RepID=UPI002F35940C